MQIAPTKKQLSYFNASIAMSEQSDYPKHKLGCVAVEKHRIISSGCNSTSKCALIQKQIDTKRFGGEHRGCVHAETDTLLPLIKANRDLSNCDLFVARKHKNGTLAMARPCAGCMSLLNACGIKRVFYTTENGYAMERIG